jgi:alpha-N-acetylglucosaminidase
VNFNSERDAAQESLFDAQPGLTAHSASHWSPQAMRYDAEDFKRVLPEFLQVAPALRASETYQYDLVDVARQTLANESRLLLPQINAAYDGQGPAALRDADARWLQLMDLQDQLLAANRFFLVGTWLADVGAWASSPRKTRSSRIDARSILTTWGDRKASEGADLHDYGNKDWAGLTRDYYRRDGRPISNRSMPNCARGTHGGSIDWFALGDAWNHGTEAYSDRPHGDAYAIARRIASALKLETRH